MRFQAFPLGLGLAIPHKQHLHQTSLAMPLHQDLCFRIQQIPSQHQQASLVQAHKLNLLHRLEAPLLHNQGLLEVFLEGAQALACLDMDHNPQVLAQVYWEEAVVLDLPLKTRLDLSSVVLDNLVLELVHLQHPVSLVVRQIIQQLPQLHLLLVFLEVSLSYTMSIRSFSLLRQRIYQGIPMT